MSIDFLVSTLNNMKNPSRINRATTANIVLAQPKLIKDLTTLTFDTKNKLSIKAAWVLEWICTHNGIELIHPYLDNFSENISKLTFDSAVRPCAKICEQLAIAYTSKEETATKKVLKETHIEHLIETGFDWLISDQKIAVRAYTMNMLYLFGIQKKWIHPELEHLIRTKIIHESSGCEARGKKILSLIQKNN